MAKKKENTAPVRKARVPSPEEVSVKNDPRKWVIFYNAEGPKEDIHFNYGGEKFHLIPGGQYELPLCVIKRLRSLALPIYKQVQRPDGSGADTMKVGANPRFILNDVEDVPETAPMATGTEPNTQEKSNVENTT
ncbi:hypothetical protein CMI37_23050 [Candidatus Pacearchaeota archaeon]|nr:hypothetical protein [Candidatus Pacearchaeota archaeon]|tara:strand:- start:264 stop:665 length:402 start_codon:yes stop_codon:yes gene_type:complete